MSLRVFIVDTLNRATASELSVLEEITAARCEQFLAERARYIPPNTNAAKAARLAGADSDAPSLQAGDGGFKVDAGQTTGPANPAFSLASEEEQLGAERLEAVVAWDLTLRCPKCGSSVDGNVRKYHCFKCERTSR